MPDVIEQTSNGRTVTTRWWSNFLTTQTMLGILAGFVSLVIFWKDSKDNWAKIATKADESEILSLKEQVSDLEKKVNNQYSVQRTMNENENKAIEEVADWMHEEIGYRRGLQEKSKQQ